MEPDIPIAGDTTRCRQRAPDPHDPAGVPPIDAHRPPPGQEDEDEDETPIGDPDDDDWEGEDWDEDDDEPLRAGPPAAGGPGPQITPANRR